jgi:hypothetical protein
VTARPFFLFVDIFFLGGLPQRYIFAQRCPRPLPHGDSQLLTPPGKLLPPALPATHLPLVVKVALSSSRRAATHYRTRPHPAPSSSMSSLTVASDSSES